jgi:DNA-binding response OmpR family regulator
LDTHVSRLRRKLADADAGVEIHGIRGIGYLLQQI